MKLPSQKYRKAVAAQINDLVVWRSAWMSAEAGSVKSAQYRVWFVEAKQRLALDLGIWLYSDDTEESLAAELVDALNDLDTCNWVEQVREDAEAAAAADAERQAEREEAERAAERPDVTTYTPVLVTKGGVEIECDQYQTAQYDLCQDYCQEIYDTIGRFGYVDTVKCKFTTYTAAEFDQFAHTLKGYTEEAA